MTQFPMEVDSRVYPFKGFGKRLAMLCVSVDGGFVCKSNHHHDI